MAHTDLYRLPRTIVPTRYDLTLEPDLDAATFAGFESVLIDVREPVDAVVLNSLDLDIEEAWLEGPDGDRLDATTTFDLETERAIARPRPDRSSRGRGRCTPASVACSTIV